MFFTMNKLKLFLISLIICSTIFSAPLSSFAQVATPTLLGGMTLNEFCASQNQGSATLSGSSWVCTGNNQPIDMNAACNWQYNITNAFAQETSQNNPYSY